MKVVGWLVGCVAAVALSGCPGKSDPGTNSDAGQIVPASLFVTASAPAATPSKPVTLAWTLSSPVTVSLVVRAQGPGESGAGLDFAGARIASGEARYLLADGSWSEMPGVYVEAAAATGTVQVTAPLPLQGEWRYDVLAQVADSPVALATAAVLVTDKPALRVALSQRYALAGDRVAGDVVLSSGGSDRAVKLKAWWQGPGGVQVPLPALEPLAFDGKVQDVRLPLLSTRLDGAAPGAWTLKARLYDAETGALLAVGARSLEVCGEALLPVDGVAVTEDGTALSPTAGAGTVTAVSVERPGLASASVDTDGRFTLGLEPGTWLVSGHVGDSSGEHVLPPRLVFVGCTAPAPLTLGPTLDVVAKQPRAHRAPRSNTPPAAPSRKPIRILVMPSSERPPFQELSRATELPTMIQLIHGLEGKASVTSVYTLAQGGALQAFRQSLPTTDNTAEMEALAGAFGADVTVLTSGAEIGERVVFTAKAITRDRQVLLSVSREAPKGSSGATVAANSLGAELLSHGLLERAYSALDYPLDPRLNLQADFAAVNPDTTKDVTVTLTDADGTPFAGRTVELIREPRPFTSSVTAETDANGVARFSAVPVGVARNMESLTAQYRRRSVSKPFPSQEHKYGVNRGQLGVLKFNPGIPTIRPSTTLDVEVEAADVTTGTPQAQKQVEVTANLGGTTATATATTGQDGKATVQLPVGPSTGLAEVTASLKAPSGAADGGVDGGAAEATVTQNLVVSLPVVFNAQPPQGRVPNGAASLLPGSLLDNNVPEVGKAISVAVSGGGSVSSPRVTVTHDGSFEVGFVPPDTGSGTSTVEFRTLQDGEDMLVSLPVAWGPLAQAPLLWYGPNLGPSGTPPSGTTIVSVLPDGSDRKVLLTDLSPYNANPAVSWANQQTRIVYSYRDVSGPSVRVMNADGTGISTVFSWSPANRLGLVRLSASPDGLNVVGHLDPSTGWHSLVTVKLDGSGIVSTRPEETYWTDYRALSWGANGKIGVVRTDQQVVSVDVSDDADVTTFSALIQWPNSYPADVGIVQGFAWSPDGTEVALACDYKGTPSILRVKTIGTGLQVPVALPSLPPCYANPSDISYSPDGSRLAFVGCCGGTKGLCTMNVDGSDPQLVDATAGLAVSISW